MAKLAKGLIASWEDGLKSSHPTVWNRAQLTVYDYLLLELRLAFSDHSYLAITEIPKARPQIWVGSVPTPISHPFPEEQDLF